MTSITIRQMTSAALASHVTENVIEAVYAILTAMLTAKGVAAQIQVKGFHPDVSAMILVLMNAVDATLGAAHAIEAAFVILIAQFPVVGAAQMMTAANQTETYYKSISSGVNIKCS